MKRSRKTKLNYLGVRMITLTKESRRLSCTTWRFILSSPLATKAASHLSKTTPLSHGRNLNLNATRLLYFGIKKITRLSALAFYFCIINCLNHSQLVYNPISPSASAFAFHYCISFCKIKRLAKPCNCVLTFEADVCWSGKLCSRSESGSGLFAKYFTVGDT
jgi:hypothetical protein